MTVLELMTTSKGSATYENPFTRVCSVCFITSVPFGASIESCLHAVMDNHFRPEVTEKKYFYRHDGPLKPGSFVIVPARNTITIAKVHQINLEHTQFAAGCAAACSTMKKVMAVVAWSPTLTDFAAEERSQRTVKAKITPLEKELAKARKDHEDILKTQQRIMKECDELKVLKVQSHNRISGLVAKINELSNLAEDLDKLSNLAEDLDKLSNLAEDLDKLSNLAEDLDKLNNLIINGVL